MNNNLDVNEDIQVSGQTIMNGIVRMHGLVPYDAGFGDMEFIVCGPTGFVSRTGLTQLKTLLLSPPPAELDYCASTLPPQWFSGTNKLFAPCPDIKVGIGTSNPNHSLTVIGNAYSRSFLAGNSGGTTTALLNGFANNHSDNLIELGKKIGAGIQTTYFSINNAGATEITNVSSAPALTINSGTGHAIVINDNAGNKLIQVENDGLLRSRSVRVDLNAWADYVFKPSYQLMTLKETHHFIQENGHLPDVPSEEELKTGGLDLGEMQRIQMQKIEELTLHLIEMDKRMTDLEAENKALKEQLK